MHLIYILVGYCLEGVINKPTYDDYEYCSFEVGYEILPLISLTWHKSVIPHVIITFNTDLFCFFFFL